MSDAPLPSSFDGNEDFYNEKKWQKLKRRIVEEPLIPFGCMLTVMALVGATRSMRAGDHAKTNIMFRRRIYAQGFTIVAMAAGSMYWEKDREKRKEYNVLVEEKKKQDKRDAWIRELEARDEEEKAFKRAMDRKRGRGPTMAKDAKPAEPAEATPATKATEIGEPKETDKVVESTTPPGTQNQVRSTVEPSEERGPGVMDAVRELISKKK